MTVTLFNQQKQHRIPTAHIKKMLLFLLKEKKVTCAETVLHFVTKRKICQLHKIFFNDPTPTDCISFPLDPSSPFNILGEIFVCPQVAFEYALEHEKKFKEELALYIIHGFLHLLGFDDLSVMDKKKMRRQETLCLKSLAKKKLFPYNLK